MQHILIFFTDEEVNYEYSFEWTCWGGGLLKNKLTKLNTSGEDCIEINDGNEEREET